MDNTLYVTYAIGTSYTYALLIGDADGPVDAYAQEEDIAITLAPYLADGYTIVWDRDLEYTPEH